jgi:dethiobiotin synthetase
MYFGVYLHFRQPVLLTVPTRLSCINHDYD